MKKIYIIVFIFIYAVNAFSQQSHDTILGINIDYGEQSLGFPYHFSTSVPDMYTKWELSIAEFNGEIIFYDEGTQWLEGGYVWNFDSNIVVFPAVNYIVSISFFDDYEKLVRTEIKQFSVPIAMNKQKAPTLFFDGYTATLSKEIFHDRDPFVVFDFIAEKANSDFASANIRLRGHAAIVGLKDTNTVEGKRNLIALSERRISYVLKELEKRGIESVRISMEALGGSEQISFDEQQRWKNRRVEVFFSYPISRVPVQETNSKQTDTIQTDTVLAEPILIPQTDMPIMGDGQVNIKEIIAFILYNVPSLDADYVEKIVLYYIQESNREKVNYDVATAQMLLETNFLQFTGVVQREQFNFAGIGSINTSTAGHWFPSELTGVRAHIQHLKGYATRSLLVGKLVDPRYPILERLGLIGSSPTVKGLSGRWATEPEYGNKIISIVRKMYNFANAILKSY